MLSNNIVVLLFGQDIWTLNGQFQFALSQWHCLKTQKDPIILHFRKYIVMLLFGICSGPMILFSGEIANWGECKQIQRLTHHDGWDSDIMCLYFGHRVTSSLFHLDICHLPTNYINALIRCDTHTQAMTTHNVIQIHKSLHKFNLYVSHTAF